MTNRPALKVGYTVRQREDERGFPKPAELIEITGWHAFEATDRKIVNLLYWHAHDSGRISDPAAVFSIPMCLLRTSRHKSNDYVQAALDRLRNHPVVVTYESPRANHLRVLETPIFRFLDPANDGTPANQVRYALPAKLLPIITRSKTWGRIRPEVVTAMTSKYAIALYELIQLRAEANAEQVEAFTSDRFRALMGVPPGSLLRPSDFARIVVEPAVAQVNRLTRLKVSYRLRSPGPRAPIHSVTLAWKKKPGPRPAFAEMPAAMTLYEAARTLRDNE